MTPERAKRKLSAILSADVKGYSRLMGQDELTTVETLKKYREVMTTLIQQYRGRVVDSPGDNLLAEFGSVVDAAECAVEIQKELKARNTELPENRRMEFRIGVNLGDVIEDENRIYGDGVNIAARVEGLAEGGGICISGTVYDAVENKLGLEYEYLGEQEVKNITKPVRVYRVQMESEAAVPSVARSLELPDKPSIAVLPFENMSGDPEQDFFADGMADDIITALSRMPWFFVIARNSSFTYKGRAVDVKQVSKELGVKYVLEGSVRKAGNRLRITAQLIDATTGQHVWADHYDRQISDIFEIQDEVTQAIVGTVAPEFLSVEAKSARRKDPAQLDAWECVVCGRAHLWKMGREDAVEARQLFERAIELAPNGEFGMADLALVHFLEFYYRWSDSAEQSLEEMLRTAEMAVGADDHDPWALTVLAWALTFAHRADKALPPVERAIEQSPNFAPAIGCRGLVLAAIGEADQAIDCFRKAVRLSPRDRFMVFWYMGLYWTHFIEGRYEEAVKIAQQAISIAPNNPTFRRQLASAYAMLDRMADAREALKEYLRLEPSHTIADASKVPTKIPEHLERFVEGLRRAGLSD